MATSPQTQMAVIREGQVDAAGRLAALELQMKGLQSQVDLLREQNRDLYRKSTQFTYKVDNERAGYMDTKPVHLATDERVSRLWYMLEELAKNLGYKRVGAVTTPAHWEKGR